MYVHMYKHVGLYVCRYASTIIFTIEHAIKHCDVNVRNDCLLHPKQHRRRLAERVRNTGHILWHQCSNAMLMLKRVILVIRYTQ